MVSQRNRRNTQICTQILCSQLPRLWRSANRPRTYIIGFDTERFAPDRLAMLPTDMPRTRAVELYHDLNDLLEHDCAGKVLYGIGIFGDTRQASRASRRKRLRIGYRIVNAEGIERPIANTLLATGGSGRERNLIYDPKEGIAGQIIKGKKTPLNDKGIRVMTPTEWGKLQAL